MNINETKKEWHVSKKEVLCFCDEGMVLGVYKMGNEYVIPDGTPKPPCHSKSAVLMLENIELIKNENANPWIRGFSFERLDECYSYFLDCGFIAGYESPRIVEGERNSNREALRNALIRCRITSRGNELINRDNMVQRKLHVDEINVGAKASIGIGEFHGNVKMKR